MTYIRFYMNLVYQDLDIVYQVLYLSRLPGPSYRIAGFICISCTRTLLSYSRFYMYLIYQDLNVVYQVLYVSRLTGPR